MREPNPDKTVKSAVSHIMDENGIDRNVSLIRRDL